MMKRTPLSTITITALLSNRIVLKVLALLMGYSLWFMTHEMLQSLFPEKLSKKLIEKQEIKNVYTKCSETIF